MKATTLIYLFFSLLLNSCSDKYSSLQRLNVAPQILTDKDSMTIREKDYSNYYTGAGFIRITAKDSMAAGMYLTVYDSTNHLEVFYDSVRLTKPVAINQYTVLYIACKDTGVFPLTVKIVDRLEKESTKIIPVKVVANQLPEAVLQVNPINYAPGVGIYNLDASKSFSAMSRIVHYTFLIDNNETSMVKPSIKTTLYSGIHTIGLSVTDDLGARSMLKTELIVIP
jgi:hypothetical protein